MNDDFSLKTTSVLHIAVAAALAFGTDSVVRQLWRKGHPEHSQQGGYRSTILFGFTHTFAVAARVYLCLIATELALRHIPVITEVFAGGTRAFEEQRLDLRQAAPSVACTIWMGMSVCTIKRVLLLQSVAGKTLGRVALFDRLLDFLITIVTLLNVLDLLQIDLSVGMQSILSMGGMGALVFSLASKDLAEGLVGGFAVQAWDAFNVGDTILLGDGTEGVVVEVGLVETHLKGYDNVVTRIPNSQLTTARVSNLSRVKRSRLVQNIRFKHKDLDMLPTVLEEIKAEIQLSCPKVVTDGSGAFFAVLEEYKSDHISGLVIANFDIPPRTLDFINNRHEFVLAIARAMKKHNVDFAIPSIEYCGSNQNMTGSPNGSK